MSKDFDVEVSPWRRPWQHPGWTRPARRSSRPRSAELDLDAKARLLAGQDMWSLPALPEIGLKSLVMSDGPIGVRGVRWTADDPSIALPSPTALAATWDPALAHRAGALLAQEARRKGVHVLLAPTVNLHRSPLGGRHFEAYSEDPYPHRARSARLCERRPDRRRRHHRQALRRQRRRDRPLHGRTTSSPNAPCASSTWRPSRPSSRTPTPGASWPPTTGSTAPTMTEHRYLVNEVLRGEWGFDGFNVSDWMAARSTVGAASRAASTSPCPARGPCTASRSPRPSGRRGRGVDGRRRPYATSCGSPPASASSTAPNRSSPNCPRRWTARRWPARSPAAPSCSYATNGALPLGPGTVALIGAAARDARVLGGGSAIVFPSHVVSPLDGLTAALPEGTLTLRRRRRPERGTRRRRQGVRAARRLPRRRTATSSAPAPRRTARSSGSATTSPRASPTHPAHRRADRHLHSARERRAHLRHQGTRRLHPHRRRHDLFDDVPARPRRTTRSRRSSAPRCRAPSRTDRGRARRRLPHPRRHRSRASSP